MRVGEQRGFPGWRSRARGCYATFCVDGKADVLLFAYAYRTDIVLTALGGNMTRWRFYQVYGHWLWAAFLVVSVVVLVSLFLFGCSGSLERNRAEWPGWHSDVEYCRRLDDRAATWGTIGKGSVVLSSGTGLSTLPVEPEDKTLRLGLAGASLGFAALAVAALYASDAASESWARDCAANEAH